MQRSLACVGAALILYTVYLHTGFAHTWEVQQSEGVASFAKGLERDPPLPPLLHVDSPYALQFHLNTMDLVVSFQDAAAALASAAPSAVAVHDISRLQKSVGDEVMLFEVGSCPDSREGEQVMVFSNQPR